MDVLVIGCSSFARRRVLPALATLDGVDAVHVASRSTAGLADVPRRGRWFADYQQAIDATPPGLVYVSLTNDAHARWVEAALERGHHVVVDKPAFTELAAAERLVALACDRGRVLAEATTYAFHPLWAQVQAIFAEHGSAPSHVTVAFTPPLPPDNYRFRRALGGGALLDAGPYFASIGRLVWGAAPEWLSACIDSVGAEVETSFSVLARYGAGRALVGHFGFTAEYRNWIGLLGPGLDVEVPGGFSTPPDRVTEIKVRHRDAISTRQAPAAPAMRLFLEAVLGAIAREDWTTLGQTLLDDARVLDRLLREVRAL